MYFCPLEVLRPVLSVLYKTQKLIKYKMKPIQGHLKNTASKKKIPPNTKTNKKIKIKVSRLERAGGAISLNNHLLHYFLNFLADFPIIHSEHRKLVFWATEHS